MSCRNVCGGAFTVVLSVAEFPPFTVAMFVSVPVAFALISTVTVMKSVEFAGTVRFVHVTREEPIVPPFEALTNVTWGGRSSVTVTLFAAVKAALLMLMVYVTRSFWFTVVRLSVFAIVRLTDDALEPEETAELTELEDEDDMLDKLLFEVDELLAEERLLEEFELVLDDEDTEELEEIDEGLLEADEETELITDELLIEEKLFELDCDEGLEELKDDELELNDDETLLEELMDELELLPATNICLLMKTIPEQRPAATLTTPFSGVTSNWLHPFGTISVTAWVPGATLSKRARPYTPLNVVCDPSKVKVNCGVTGNSLPFMSYACL